MQIVLLSGGSGTRLWPLSNDVRSKQFLRLLPKENSHEKESMVQRVVRQLRQSGITNNITVATSLLQHDSIVSQLGNDLNIVTEPLRRNTFPAICLASEYLNKVKECSETETVVVIPCDPFTEAGYFNAIGKMIAAIERGIINLAVMGIRPTYPSSKYGYVVPGVEEDGVFKVIRFTEKPDTDTARRLIEGGARWNGGVFAFRLGYLLSISRKYVYFDKFEEIRNHYNDYPKISFDYEVAEKAENIGMIPYDGTWKDLGTWNTLTDELPYNFYGNVTTDGNSKNTHIFNELDLPLMCIGTSDLIIAASPDGILVSEKSKSEGIKEYADKLKLRPMYEEQRWGIYRVVDHTKGDDGFHSLTKRLTLNAGASISYQKHNYRNEVWIFIHGEGEIIIGNDRKKIGRGDTITIPSGTLHALKAITPLTLIEVQMGTKLIEEDIERFPYDW